MPTAEKMGLSFKESSLKLIARVFQGYEFPNLLSVPENLSFLQTLVIV